MPRHIYWSDDAVAGNIAFGVPPPEIDLDAVHNAARRARIFDVVEELPRRGDKMVGERGVKLSGGSGSESASRGRFITSRLYSSSTKPLVRSISRRKRR